MLMTANLNDKIYNCVFAFELEKKSNVQLHLNNRFITPLLVSQRTRTKAPVKMFSSVQQQTP